MRSNGFVYEIAELEWFARRFLMIESEASANELPEISECIVQHVAPRWPRVSVIAIAAA